MLKSWQTGWLVLASFMLMSVAGCKKSQPQAAAPATKTPADAPKEQPQPAAAEKKDENEPRANSVFTSLPTGAQSAGELKKVDFTKTQVDMKPFTIDQIPQSLNGNKPSPAK